MEGGGEELVVGPRRASHRTRFLAGCLLVVVLALSMLTSGTLRPACQPPSATPAPPPWLPADHPFVRNLHFAALDRARAPLGSTPPDVLPADVRRSARRLGDAGGIVVYLAGGKDFVCLGVDGRAARHSVTSVCMLDTTIANEGLAATVWSAGAADSLLVVAVPDGARLRTGPLTERFADYTSAVVVRPDNEQVLLEEPGRPPVVVRDVPVDDAPFGMC